MTNAVLLRSLSRAALTLVALAMPVVTQSQSTYKVVQITLPGIDGSVGFAINGNGQVAGYVSSTSTNGQIKAFRYSGAVPQTLDTLGGAQCEAYGINDSGQVTGFSELADGVTNHAFYYDGVSIKDIGTLGGAFSFAYGINNGAQITGYSTLSGGNAHHAFQYRNGIMYDLGTLGGSNSEGSAINQLGQMTGDADTSPSVSEPYGATHAFFYSNSAMFDIHTLGGSQSAGRAINNLGQIAGNSATFNNTYHAFLYSGGVMGDLGTLGGDDSYATGINDSADVVGNADVPSSGGFMNKPPAHAFLFTASRKMFDLNTFFACEFRLASGQCGCDQR